MKWRTHLQTGLINLLSAKLRSLLALLGVLVGTAAVVAMVSGGELATNEALKQFKTLGTDLLAVSVGDRSDQVASSVESLSLKKANEIVLADENILNAAPYTQFYNVIKFAGHQVNGGLLGVTGSFANIVHVEVAQGRMISDLDKYEPYCVIGAGIYDEMKKYTLDNPIGQQIQVGKTLFTIIGVAKPWSENSFVYASVDQSVIVPILTSVILSKYAAINNIVMRLSPTADSEKVTVNTEKYLQNSIKNKQFFFRSAKQLVQQMRKQSDILTLFLGLIGGISLIVGGIGVMNIMLVSVIERRREIGIRLAVGAKSKDIALLFLMEAVLLSVLGGTLGVLIGMIATYIIAVVSHWEFTILFLPPLIGFTVSVAVGIFFGFYPAYKAAKLDPIQALRAD